MIRKFTSLLFALLLSILSTSAVFAASYPSPPAVTEDAAASSGDRLSPAGVVIKGGNDTALAAEGDYTTPTCNDVGNLKTQNEPSRKATYMASTPFFTAANSATDIFELYGSSTKTLKILEVYVDWYQTGAVPNALNPFYLLRRSTANSSGTPVNTTVAKLDSNNGATTANTVRHYTANPTTGTAAGQIAAMAVQGHNPQNQGGFAQGLPQMVCLYKWNPAAQAVTLRGTSEGLVVNLGGTTLGGTSPVVSVTVLYTEESSVGFLIIYLGRLFLLIRRRKPLTLNNVVNLFGAERKVA